MSTQSSDTSPEAERVQLALLRAASAGKRLSLANALSRMALQLSTRGLRRAHPGASRRELAWLAVGHYYGQALGERARLRTEGIVIMPVAPDLVAAMAPVTQALERLGAAYYVGGSIASSIYGIPRATLDVDLIADLKAEQVAPLVEQLQDAYYISEDAARDAIRHQSSFNVIHLQTMLKLDIFVRKTRAFDDEAFRRARREQVDDESGQTLVLPTPEDILLAKLEWYRQGAEVSDRQWGDILGILKVQGQALDLGYARQWATSLEVADLLERALGEAGLVETTWGAVDTPDTTG